MTGNKAQEGAALMQALVTGFQAVVASNRAVVASNDRLAAAQAQQAQAQATLAGVVLQLTQRIDTLGGRMDFMTDVLNNSLAEIGAGGMVNDGEQRLDGGSFARGLAGAALRGLVGGFRPQVPMPPYYGPSGGGR